MEKTKIGENTPEEEQSMWDAWANDFALHDPETAEKIVENILDSEETRQQGSTTVE